MIYVFKIFGACFMICSCWGYGVYKSLDLKNKRDNMANLILGLDTFQNNIRISLEETLPLFKKSFDEYNLFDTQEKIVPKENAFFEKDRDIITDFLSGIGNSDKQGECERIKAYKEILNKRYAEISEEYKNKSKVWQTLGLCFGITVALILI
ncbi:MAG: stage III sporulation protein AB [Clostridia bacterium]|nr:stage III sporulation protein AB [Clostridia bacterium]